MVLKLINIARFTILTALIFFNLFACNSSTTKGKIESKKDTLYSTMGGDTSYFPLIEKGIWEYINEAPRKETETFKVELKQLSITDGKKIAEYTLLPYFLKNDETRTKLKMDSSGNLYIIDNDGSEQLFIPAVPKLTAGYRWKCGNWDANVAYLNESIKTEFDTYENCIHLIYNMGGMTFSTEIWLAKGRGIVKWGANRTNPPTLNPTFYILKEVNFK